MQCPAKAFFIFLAVARDFEHWISDHLSTRGWIPAIAVASRGAMLSA